MNLKEHEVMLLGKKAKYKKVDDGASVATHAYTVIRYPFKADIKMKEDEEGDIVQATWTLYPYTGSPLGFGGLFGGGGDGALGTQTYIQSPQSIEDSGKGLDPQGFFDKCVKELEELVDVQCKNLVYYIERGQQEAKEEKKEEPQIQD